jgi:hypothetical protein
MFSISNNLLILCFENLSSDNSKEAVYDYDTEFPGLQDNNYGI